eukprot:5681462-Heterocapsa_arctica.AAC.1
MLRPHPEDPPPCSETRTLPQADVDHSEFGYTAARVQAARPARLEPHRRRPDHQHRVRRNTAVRCFIVVGVFVFVDTGEVFASLSHSSVAITS